MAEISDSSIGNESKPNISSAPVVLIEGHGPSKRPRSSDPGPAGPHYFKDESLWFPQGNLIFIAGGTAFRLHQDFLSRRSHFFRQMFTHSVPSDGEDTIEGCPVIRVQDDTESFAILIKALYDGMTFDPRNPVTGKQALPVFALADKYAISDLRQRSLACLSIAWPSTLEEYDLRIARRREQKALRGTSKYPHNKSSSVILVARKTGALHLLPSAHYLLCQRYMESLAEATGPDSGAVANVIPPEEFRAFVLFREKLTALCNKFIVDLLARNAAPTCTQGGACKREYERLGLYLAQGTLIHPCRIVPFPLECALKAGEKFDKMNAACTECKADFQQSIRVFRAGVWNDLPSFLALESWDRLRDASATDAAVLEEMLVDVD